MEDNIENEDSLNLDLDLGDESNPTGPSESEKKLFARAKKAEAELKALKAKSQNLDNLPAENKPAPKLDDQLWEVADYIREGYSRNEVAFITANGGREALKDPNSLVSLAIKSAKEQRQAEDAGSKTSDASGLSEVERKYTPQQLKEMSREELAKILPHA